MRNDVIFKKAIDFVFVEGIELFNYILVGIAWFYGLLKGGVNNQISLLRIGGDHSSISWLNLVTSVFCT